MLHTKTLGYNANQLVGFSPDGVVLIGSLTHNTFVLYGYDGNNYTLIWTQGPPVGVTPSDFKYILGRTGPQQRLLIKPSAGYQAHVFFTNLTEEAEYTIEHAILMGVLSHNRSVYLSVATYPRHLLVFRSAVEVIELVLPEGLQWEGTMSACSHPENDWIAVAERDEKFLAIFNATGEYNIYINMGFGHWFHSIYISQTYVYLLFIRLYH